MENLDSRKVWVKVAPKMALWGVYGMAILWGIQTVTMTELVMIVMVMKRMAARRELARGVIHNNRARENLHTNLLLDFPHTNHRSDRHHPIDRPPTITTKKGRVITRLNHNPHHLLPHQVDTTLTPSLIL